jgi:hypothetical protein
VELLGKMKNDIQADNTKGLTLVAKPKSRLLRVFLIIISVAHIPHPKVAILGNIW